MVFASLDSGGYSRSAAKAPAVTSYSNSGPNYVNNGYLPSYAIENYGGFSNMDLKGLQQKPAGSSSGPANMTMKFTPPKKPKGSGNSADNTAVPPIPPSNPADYKWNLPPHKWSTPKDPVTYTKKNGGDIPAGYDRPKVNNLYRRGRIWWKYSDPSISVDDGTGSAGSTKKLTNTASSRQYGFQFLWNPESFGTQVAVQMNAAPQESDRFLAGVGFFPATEVVSFNIRIDRTNDFAAAAAHLKRPSYTTVGAGAAAATAAAFVNKSDIKSWMKDGYKSDYFFSGKSNMDEQLVDLFQRGTLADLEYLYRAINGKGPSSTSTWVNGRGTQTADIGYLQPTLLNIDIGPVSYAGYVTAMSVNHIAFTRDMIPIRTDVNVSLNVLATSSLGGPNGSIAEGATTSNMTSSDVAKAKAKALKKRGALRINPGQF